MTTKLVEDFLKHLGAMEQEDPFDITKAAQSVLAAGRNTSATKNFKATLDGSKLNLHDVHFDGTDCSSTIEKIVACSAALGFLDVNDGVGFHGCVNKDKATSLMKTTFADFFPYLYAHHLNVFIQKKMGKSMKDLCNDAEFVKLYGRTINRNHTYVLMKIHTETDVTRAHSHSMNLLFAYQYLKHKGPAPLVTSGCHAQHGSHTSEDPSSWVDILHKWCETAKDNCESSLLSQHQLSLTASASAVFAPNKELQCSPKDIAASCFGNDAPCCNQIRKSVSEKADQIRKGKTQYTTIGSELLDAWYIAYDALRVAVKGAIEKRELIGTEEDEPYTDINGYEMGSSGISRDTYERGKKAAEFIDDWDHLDIFYEDRVKEVNRVRIKSEVRGPFGCFTPGTRIITPNSATTIETLEAGSTVRGRLSIETESSVVKQRFTVSGIDRTLYGFNDEQPFFTANHCFYTTTGIRAIDPIAARKQNPWAKIGKLEPGHVLFRTEDDTTYTFVHIERILSEISTHEELYDLHFDDPAVVYHANGYLVQSNMPRTTTSKLADSLSGLTPAQQLAALKKLPELREIIERFGSSTIVDALQRQLQDKRYKSEYLDPAKVVQSKLYSAVTLNTLTRTWKLDDAEETSAENALPTLTVADNVLAVDGVYCERALIKPSLLVWSRELSPNLFEHGYCKFTKPLYHGSGVVFYSENANVDFAPEEGLRKFTARVAPGQPIAFIRTKALTTASIRDKVADDELVARDIQFDALEVNKKPLQFAKKASLEQDLKLPEGAYIPEEYQGSERFMLKYEKEASEPKKNWEELASPVDLFEVTFVDLTKESAVPLHQYRAPILDKIQNAYTLKAQSKLNQAQDYGTEIYKPEIHNEGGNITATIKLNAPLVSMASDQYEEDSPLPTHKLTFQKLGVDFTLPFLFSQIKFKIPYIEEPSGVIYELDTEKEEFNGSPHRLIGEILDDEESNSVTKNLIQSSIPSAAAIGDRLSSATVSHSPPAPVFQNKEYRKAGEVLTVTTLSELNIDNKLLTDTAQDLIYKAMVYHMDAGDRKVLNADIPSVGSETDIGTLPYALANELTGDMRDWLKNTYARAVVALSFSNLSAITLKDWIVKYSDKQVKQIRYWWSGKGPRCLANDKHYRLLNQIATTYAARRICKGLRPFLDDTVPDEQKRVGGDKWASALFEKYSVEGKKTKREKRLAEYAFGNLVKDMNKDYYVKLMNILQALEPIGFSSSGTKQYAVRLSDMVVAAVYYKGSNVATNPMTPDYWKKHFDWVDDALIRMITGLLTNAPEYAHLRQQFDKCAALVAEKHADWKKKSINDRAELIKQAMTFNLYDLYGGIVRLRENWKNALERLGPVARAMGFRERAALCADGAWRNGPIVPAPIDGTWKHWIPLAKGIFTVGAFAFELYNTIDKFNDLTPAGKPRAIVNCLKSALNAIGNLPGAFNAVKSYSQWKVARANARIPPVEGEEIAPVAPGLARSRAPTRVLADAGAEGVGPAPVSPSAMTKWARRIYSGLQLLLSLASLATSIYELCQDGDAVYQGYWLLILQIFVQAVAFLCEAVVILGITGSIATISSFLGPALALVGLILLIVIYFVVKRKRTEKTEAEKWIDGTGKAFTEKLDDPPSSKLSWSISPLEVQSGTDVLLTFTGKNNTGNAVRFENLYTRITAGGSDENLFVSSIDEEWSSVPYSSDLSTLNPKQVTAHHSSSTHKVLATITQDGPPQVGETEKTFVRGFKILVKNQIEGKMVEVGAGETVSLHVKGRVCGKGSEDKFKDVGINVEERWVDGEDVMTEIVSTAFTVHKK